MGLKGQIGSICIFSEPLQASQVKMMYSGGPKNYTLFKNEDSVDITDLLSKLVVNYDGKASVDSLCTNLAPSLSLYDGKLNGRRCHLQNIKDTMNLIGGYPTLYLLLENSGKPIPQCSPSFETASPLSSSQKSTEEALDDWIVVPSASSSFSGESSEASLGLSTRVKIAKTGNFFVSALSGKGIGCHFFYDKQLIFTGDLIEGVMMKRSKGGATKWELTLPLQVE